jgi:hypothetical protein
MCHCCCLSDVQSIYLYNIVLATGMSIVLHLLQQKHMGCVERSLTLEMKSLLKLASSAGSDWREEGTWCTRGTAQGAAD